MVTYKSQPDEVFRALADPTRRAILDLLRVREQPVGGIAARFRVSRPAISKHLRLLREANLVVERREGRQRICELNVEPLRRVDDWLGHYRRFWSEALGRLKQHIESQEERRAP